jgi:hypothetical protein
MVVSMVGNIFHDSLDSNNFTHIGLVGLFQTKKDSLQGIFETLVVRESTDSVTDGSSSRFGFHHDTSLNQIFESID